MIYLTVPVLTPAIVKTGDDLTMEMDLSYAIELHARLGQKIKDAMYSGARIQVGESGGS